MTRKIITWPFFWVTLAITGLILFELSRHADGVFAWILFGFSVIPIYATIYEVGYTLKAILFHRRWTRAPYPLPDVLAEPPGVAFLIASYQEPFEVAKMTFDCARDTAYPGPREIIVVDNSKDRDAEEYRRWKEYVESHIGRDENVRVIFRYNTKTGGLKPGNVDLAQSLIGESRYVVLLDIDSSLPVYGDFLSRAVNEFECDETLGVLQFNTMATNDHFNQLTGPIAVTQSAMHVGQMVRGYGGFAIFYGHNAMWRRSTLDASGPWLEHYRGNVMLSEDLLKTVSAYSRGYTSRYMDVATGEWIPSSLESLESMYMRWAYGTFQVFFKRFKQIVTTPGLDFLQRIDLVLSMVGYIVGAIFFPLSVVWLFFFPARTAGAITLFMLLAPPIAAAWLVYLRYIRQLSSSRLRKFWDLYSGVFIVRYYTLMIGMRSAINFLIGVRQGWRVTSKGFEERPSWPQVIRRNAYVVALSVLILAAFGVAWGVRTGFSAAAVTAFIPSVLLVSVNLILCVLLYGRQARTEEGTVEGTGIDGFNLRNSVLDRVPLFHGTNAQFQHNLALSLRSRKVPAGSVIVAEGAPGSEMFFIAHGQVGVSSGGRELRTLDAGSFFGERSLLLGEPRSATVRADTDCEVFALDKEAFVDALRAQPKVARRVVGQAKTQYAIDLAPAIRSVDLAPSSPS
ncbi:cyclic nucleotide-binding domain-containing protein [Streptomyces erythrochromogenes]|uniref:cyclic nucleotide-binding domain-containing protein n=1 Tax=Streptomyces erythrochromogenes TaxID=285574 RepID=UPI003440148C